jgi:hypothetical protein
MVQKFFKNKNLSKKLKLRLKNTKLDKTLTYASETWTLTERDRKQLNNFERKIYRRILSPIYDKASIISPKCTFSLALCVAFIIFLSYNCLNPIFRWSSGPKVVSGIIVKKQNCIRSVLDAKNW